MQVNRGERLNNARNSDSDYVKDVRVLFEEHENVAVTRAHALDCDRLVELVKRDMNHFRMRQVDANTDTIDLVCELVSVIILKMNRQ